MRRQDASHRRRKACAQRVVTPQARADVSDARPNSTTFNSPRDSSDADADVLADYVVALVTAGDSDDTDSIRKTCLSDLEDFLQDRKCQR